MELSFAGSDIDNRTGSAPIGPRRRRGAAAWSGGVVRAPEGGDDGSDSSPPPNRPSLHNPFPLWAAGPGLRMGYHVVAVHPVHQADPMRSIPYAGEALRVLGESPGLAICELTVPPR